MPQVVIENPVLNSPLEVPKRYFKLFFCGFKLHELLAVKVIDMLGEEVLVVKEI